MHQNKPIYSINICAFPPNLALNYFAAHLVQTDP